MRLSKEEVTNLRTARPERCETCAFWLCEESDAIRQVLNPADGACRRYPPAPQGWLRRNSPNHLTGPFQWCGEWRDFDGRRSKLFEHE